MVVFRGCKKDHATRCQELLTGSGLGGGSSNLAVRLAKCARNADGGPVSWARAGGPASEILLEVCTNATLAKCAADDVEAVVSAVAEASSSSSSSDDGDEPLLTHYFGSRFLRRLALTQVADGCSHPASAVFDVAIKGKVASLLGTHAEKVVAALSDCPDESTRKACVKELKAALKKQSTTLENWKEKFTKKD